MASLTEQQILNCLRNKVDRRNQIPQVFKDFTNSVIPELLSIRENGCANHKNVYQLAEAIKLSTANNITRTYSTKLGLLWEQIANLAPNVVSPEIDFGAAYKIPEVDVIVQYENKLYYTQLKTQKNTLTGSQSKRTVAELSAFPNHWFVACIDTNCDSTIPKALNKLIGRQFWEKIGIDYDKQILPNLFKSINTVEKILG